MFIQILGTNIHSPILEKFLPAINDRFNIFQSDMQGYYNNIEEGNKMFANHLKRVEDKVDASLKLQNQQIAYMIHKRNFEFNMESTPTQGSAVITQSQGSGVIVQSQETQGGVGKYHLWVS